MLLKNKFSLALHKSNGHLTSSAVERDMEPGLLRRRVFQQPIGLKLSWIGIFLLIFAPLLLISCGSGAKATPASETSAGSAGLSNVYLYTSNSPAGSVETFVVNPANGALTLPRLTAFSDRMPGRLVIEPQGKLLFAASEASSSFTDYIIDPSTGILRLATILRTDAIPQDLAADGAINVVYALSPTRIWAFSYNTTSGIAMPVAGSPFQVRTASTGSSVAQRLTLDPSGSFLYVTDSLGIVVFQIGSDGSLSRKQEFPLINASLTGIAALPTAPFLYAASAATGAGQPGGVYIFSKGADGTITLIQGSPFSTGQPMREIAMDSAGQFAVVSGGTVGNGLLFVFTIDSATGLLTKVPQSPLVSRPDPLQLAIDSQGPFIYSANTDLSSTAAGYGGEIAAFAFDRSTTTLTTVPGFPLTSVSPAGIAFVNSVIKFGP